MKWKGMSTSIATRAASLGRPQWDAAVDVLMMPVHFTITTYSVEGISGGLAKSPSEVLNPPSPSPKDASCHV